ncbi:MAG TPA: valine--tRNA ligase, partial [Pseudonocardiaceae bacterium]|nr:valine--tRNA ligase [Pseudonocardiaceae bacterium]
IAGQWVVEKELAKEGLTRHDLGREKFLARVWDFMNQYRGRIREQTMILGASCDWTRFAFTMDPGPSRAVRHVFKRLYDKGLIYRGERLISWCPRCQTALSDLEVVHRDEAGSLWTLAYPVEGSDEVITVATTRPETMLGDTGVAVHPDDDRYQHLIGKHVRLPIMDRLIPIVAYEAVDPAFGSGAVKVTPAHDPNDFEIGRRHGLPMPSILDEGAVVTGTGTRFDGMDRFAARDAVREELRAQGRIVAEKRPYYHSVGHCSRCDTVIEPRLSLQWFVRVEPLAKAAGDAVRDGRVLIHPKEQEPRWFGWLDNMHDWCISRQLWWGHRIPVWYGPGGEVVCVGPDEQPPAGWTQDEDVLDTWFSSALWPFSTLGWPADTVDLRRFYPTSVLVTGYDILFFWVARMMMFGLYAMGREPFGVVVLHGLVRDQYGKKMSKSRNNTIGPLEWIERYGADALRFTLARGANPGSDQAISEEWVAGSRNFANKLWNATRFALMNGADPDAGLPAADELT